jgi:hypothetical protein
MDRLWINWEMGIKALDRTGYSLLCALFINSHSSIHKDPVTYSAHAGKVSIMYS